MEVAISGLGMVTAVGQGAVAACAAIRAGVSRPEPLEGVVVLDQESGDETTPVGFPVTGYSEGFALVGAWTRLALGALEQVAADAHLPDQADVDFWKRTALLVVAPASLVQRFGEGADDLETMRALYLDPLARLLGPGLSSAPKALIGGGHAGAAAALEQASVLLERRAADRVLVAAADSILDDLSLGWLVENGRLHSDDTPTGLIPGEAAAAVLLEPVPDAVRRAAHVHLVLQSVVTDREPEGGADPEASASARGFALGRAIRRSLEHGTGGTFHGDLIADLNGETWRAYEVGMARVSCGCLSGDNRLVLPALSLGETGAASGLIGLCVAARSLSRRYARGDEALVLSSSDDGRVGVARVRRHMP